MSQTYSGQSFDGDLVSLFIFYNLDPNIVKTMCEVTVNHNENGQKFLKGLLVRNAEISANTPNDLRKLRTS